MAAKGICSIPNCGKPLKGRGWCRIHYDRWRRHGDPLKLGKTPDGAKLDFINNIALRYAGDDCLIWPFLRSEFGYGYFHTNGRIWLAHTYICELVNGPKPTPVHISRHTCGRGHLGCVSPGHVIWGTQKENQDDRVTHGTSNRGNRNGMSKLTEVDVRQIRMLNGSLSHSEIASLFRVARESVRDIISRKYWSWLD